jgi:SAM-dependent methyltransferase
VQREIVGNEDGLDAVRCCSCGLYYINPRRRKKDKFMGSVEGADAKYGAIFRGEEPHPRDHNYEEHLRNIERLKRSGTLLDVGAHSGFLLRIAKKRGWQVYGVEPNEAKVAAARKAFGLDVHAGFLNEAPFPEHSFDVLTMTDVFEHVHDPLDLLHHAHRFLKRDGLLLIKVPNGEYSHWKSRWFQRFGTRRRCWDVNEHVVHYTRPTLEKMLRKAKFRPVQWVAAKPIRSEKYPISNPRAWAHPIYVMRELVKQGLYWYGKLQLRLRGTYFVLLPDIEVISTPED